MGEPTISGDVKTYSALSIALILITAAVREWFKARSGKSGLLHGMAIVQAEDLAATTSIRQQLQAENERLSRQLTEAYKRLDEERERARSAEEEVSSFFQATRDCVVPPEACPARLLHSERKRSTISGKFGPLEETE